MKGFILSCLVLLGLNIVLAAVPTPYDVTNFSSSINEFINAYSSELASLSLAAIASMGIRIALKKSNAGFEDNLLNGITVALTMGIFIMVYVTGAYLLFAPLISLLIITGVGFVLFNVRPGMKDAGDDLLGLANIITGLGCFLLGLLAWYIGGEYAVFMAMILFIMGIIFLFKGVKFPTPTSTSGATTGQGGRTGTGGAGGNTTSPGGTTTGPGGTGTGTGGTQVQPSTNPIAPTYDMDNILVDIEDFENKQYDIKEDLKKLFETLIKLIDSMKIDSYIGKSFVYNAKNNSFESNPPDLLNAFNGAFIGNLQRILLEISRKIELDFKKYFDEKEIKSVLKFVNAHKKHPNYVIAAPRLEMILRDILPAEIKFLKFLSTAGSVAKFKDLIQIKEKITNPGKNQTIINEIIINPHEVECTFPGFCASGGIITIGGVPITKKIAGSSKNEYINPIFAADFFGSPAVLSDIQNYVKTNNPRIIVLLSVLNKFCEYLINGPDALDYLMHLEKTKIRPIDHPIPRKFWTILWNECFKQAQDHKIPTLFMGPHLANTDIAYLDLNSPNQNSIAKNADQVVASDLTQHRLFSPTATKSNNEIKNAPLLYTPILISPDTLNGIPFGLTSRTPINFGQWTEDFKVSPTLDRLGGNNLTDYKAILFRIERRNQMDKKVNEVWGEGTGGAGFKVNNIPGKFHQFIYCMIIPSVIHYSNQNFDPETTQDFLVKLGTILNGIYP